LFNSKLIGRKLGFNPPLPFSLAINFADLIIVLYLFMILFLTNFMKNFNLIRF